MKILIAINPFLTNLEQYGDVNFTVNPWGGDPSEKLIFRELQNNEYDALIVGTKRVDINVAGICPTLKVISRVGIGYDNLDVEAFRKCGISCTYTPSGPVNSTAEHAVSMLCAASKNLVRQNNDLKNGLWNRNMKKSLEESLVGVVGTGRIGRRVIDLMKAFGCSFILYDMIQDSDFSEKSGSKYANKLELLRSADIITLHLPQKKY